MTKLEPLKGRELGLIDYLSDLPPGQQRIVMAFIGGKDGRTYIEAAKLAGVSVNILRNYVRRVRKNHPLLYKGIRAM